MKEMYKWKDEGLKKIGNQSEIFSIRTLKIIKVILNDDEKTNGFELYFDKNDEFINAIYLYMEGNEKRYLGLTYDEADILLKNLKSIKKESE